MPVLNPGVPPYIQADNQTYIAALKYYGQDWNIPSAVAFNSFTVDMASLAANPQAADPLMSPADLLASLIPGNFMNPAVLEPKQRALVERYLYDQNVSATGVEPPPADTPPVTPPTGYVPPVPPSSATDNLAWIAKKLQLIERQLEWLRLQCLSRDYFFGASKALTGSGAWAFYAEQYSETSHLVDCIGFDITITTIPGYEGRSAGGAPVLHYDLGDVSWGNDDFMSSPIKLTRAKQVIYPVTCAARSFHYRLAPGVVGTVKPLYPMQFDPDEEE